MPATYSFQSYSEYVCFPLCQPTFIPIAVSWILFIFSGQFLKEKLLIGRDDYYRPYLDSAFHAWPSSGLRTIYQSAARESDAQPWSSQLWSSGKGLRVRT